jgi:PAS domain S-box-containing protein
MPEDVMRRLEQLSEPGAILDPDLMARILDILPDAVVVIDEQGIVRFVNQATELLFGYPRVNLLGEALEMLLPERLRERHADHRRRFFHEPRTRPMGVGIGQPLMGLNRNGAEMTLEINLSPIVTGHGVYAVAVVRRRHDHVTA